MTQEEALKLAFPAGTKVERRTAFLTEEQARRSRMAGRVPVDSRVWTYYVGASTRGVDGYAYFETHTVRSQTETFMAVLDARGRLRFIEILAFHEPEDYRPPAAWLKQFEGKGLLDGLWLRRGIRNIAGASLTSAAITDGARRVLAIHAVLHPSAWGEPPR